MTGEAFLEVRGIVKHYPIYSRGIILKKNVGNVHAVDGVSFSIKRGETLGLVGESGCGKTTTAKVILNLENPTEGNVLVEGKDTLEMLELGKKKEAAKALRRKMQLVFQNPYASLDPRMTVYDILEEPLIVHAHIPKSEWGERIYSLLKAVGMEAYDAERYPHEFSGGQRQRICIARALAVDPEFIVLDEPVSSLDVSIRAQILNLLLDIQDQKDLTYLYISHDLSSVRQVCHNVAVMYLGKILEYGETNRVFDHPLNPYTEALLSAVPIPDPETGTKMIILQGEVPSPIDPPLGCRFRTRCMYATEKCKEEPQLVDDVVKGQFVACHYAYKMA